MPKAAPEVNGNVPSQEAKEVDGNKPTADAKPRRGRTQTAGNPRRRRPQTNQNENSQTIRTPSPAAVIDAPTESVAKKAVVADNVEVKVKVVRPKRIVKEVKLTEDASE
jgi:hypothetical protein